MSLKQVVKYMFNTDPDQINADIAEYKALRDACRTLKKAKDNAFTAIVVNSEMPADMSGCIQLQDSVPASLEPYWVYKDCGLFDGGMSACKNTECKYCEANQKHFDALRAYNESRRKCSGFWAMKFARMKLRWMNNGAPVLF